MYIQLVNLSILLLILATTKSANAKTKEYVFINIWDAYYQTTHMPKPQGKRIFLQPDINIDQASLEQFIDVHQEFANLTIDTNNQLTFKYQVRQTPTRVIVENGKVILKESLSTSPKITAYEMTNKQMATLSGKPLSISQIQHDYQVLFFSDSLCPFQHIPDCQQRIRQNNQLAINSPKNVLTIIKPFYAEQASALSYKKRFDVNHHIVFDAQNQLFSHFKIRDLPYWIVQDATGKVVYRGNQVPKPHHLSL
ncbi:TlpA family protein disulfide reductase [Pseudoalteromonas luteoviolacea]|uniref:TlpA family protein disulfide reductase n=1 Tax=Pseudoalteromonas luteoviolacea TaxID=43657 RepID=UPI0007B0B073|nr:hypothetical protein [Pseudoalteromonas luteoviolacea]KZN57063.1 hypothetical protein N474_00810 [Pseudoalteromonas luteoviolacea CPMOR-2]TQF72585.1 hypothetical protein FLM44_16720 [Pseudoalteromonas luteoviolacea]